MVVNVKPEDLTEAIRGSLENYSAAVTEKVNEELEKVAEDTADTLKKGGPYRERTGKYTKDWAVKTRANATAGISGEQHTVHNKKHYQLTHLLEKGHVSRSGKRVPAYPHIEPAERQVQTKAVQAVEKAVREANNKL